MVVSHISAPMLLRQIIAEVVQETSISLLEQRISNILKQAEPQLLGALLKLEEADIQTWVRKKIHKNRDELSLIKLFTKELMGAHNGLSIKKNELLDLNSTLCANETDDLENKEQLPKSLIPLPNEILTSIYAQYLFYDPSWNAVGNFAMTCIRCCNLATAPASFSELLRHGPVNQLGMSKSFVASKLRSLNKISNVTLDFTNSEPLEEKEVPLLFSCGGYRAFKLQEFNANAKKMINPRMIRQLTSHSPNLEKLALLGAQELTDETIFSLAASCTQLSSLKLTFCKNITPEALIALTACTKIHSIELDFMKMTGPETRGNQASITRFDKWSAFLIKHKNKFFKFRIGNISLTPTSYENLAIKFAPSLKSIGLTSALDCHVKIIPVFKRCPQLRHFKFLDVNAVIDDNLLSQTSEKWCELKSCTLLFARKVSVNGVQALLQHAQKLEKLTLGYYKIDAKTIQAICSYGASLEELRFGAFCGMAPGFNSVDLINSLSQNKAGLAKLKLFQLNAPSKEKITLASLTTLATSFPALEFVIRNESFPAESSLEGLNKSFPNFYLNSYF